MRVIVQQVRSAQVVIPSLSLSKSIGAGILVYLCIHVDDFEQYIVKVEQALQHLLNFRGLTGHNGAVAFSLSQLGYEMLLVSNFTLYGRIVKNNHVDFSHSASFKKAQEVYQFFVSQAQLQGLRIQTGEFGSEMEVMSINIGPINYVFDF